MNRGTHVWIRVSRTREVRGIVRGAGHGVLFINFHDPYRGSLHHWVPEENVRPVSTPKEGSRCGD
jgi:hypothetical protein